MITVLWTFRIAQPLLVAELIAIIEQSAPNYLNVPGLVRKYFGLAKGGDSIVGIYLWADRAAADAFFTPAWVEAVTRRWGAPPQRQDWDTPMVVESQEGRLVRE